MDDSLAGVSLISPAPHSPQSVIEVVLQGPIPKVRALELQCQQSALPGSDPKSKP